MINLFKDLRIKYRAVYIILLILAIASYAYILLYFSSESAIPLSLACIFCCTAIILVRLIFSCIAAKRHNKIAAELNELCDPIGFLNKYISFLQSKTDTATGILILLNLSSGYISAGDFVQAKKVLNDIPLQSANNMQLAMFYQNLSSVYLNENNLVNAERALSDAKRFIDGNGINKNFKALALESYNIHSVQLNLANNHLSGAEQTLNEIFRSASCLLHKIDSKNLLGQLYIKQGRTEEAKQALRFVADNGNTLYVAQKAKEQLALINTKH